MKAVKEGKLEVIIERSSAGAFGAAAKGDKK